MKSGLIGSFGIWKTSFAAQFWRLVPEAIFRPGFFLAEPQRLLLDTLPLDGKADEKLKEIGVNSGQVILEIAQAACLTRSVLLPKAAIPRAETAIALQVRQTMPAGAKGLLWRSQLVNQKDGGAEFHVFLLKQSQIDEVLATSRKLGADVVSVIVAGAASPPIWTKFPDQNKKLRFWAFTALCAALLPAFVSIAMTEHRISIVEARVAERTQRIAALQESLVGAREEANKSQSAVTTLQQDLSSFKSQTERVVILADITEALPDDVWISELTITGDQLQISGFATSDVAEISKVLQAESWAKTVRLEGPIILDSYSGQNRFQLSIALKSADISK